MPVVIDTPRCTGCGLCLYECGALVFAFDAEAYKAVVARNQSCVDCFICQETCPEHAIAVKLRRIRAHD
ncbi:MAG: ferredoxin family protein [Chloroflexi bacterium]|nr:ferredoxin family protein [Chloroflexota bacterium]